MPRLLCALAISFVISAVCGVSLAEKPLPQRWLYLQTNLLVDKNVDDALALLDRAKKAGYTHLAVADSKFTRWDDLPPKYLANCARVRQGCTQRGIFLAACVCHMGYSEGELGHDPNLAEGLPVKDALFVVRSGTLVPADPIQVANGDFEQFKGDAPSGWSFVDQPGKISFVDTQTAQHGKASLRMQDVGTHAPQHGHARASQTLAVQPFHYYHVLVWVKTDNWQAGQTRIAVLGEGGVSLNYLEPPIAPTQDWKRIDVTFNSLEFSKVNLYLGTWGGKGGRIWWDNLQVEPAGLVNVLRREGAPLKMTSQDGRTVYIEGKDFEKIADPKLGTVPWRGGFSAWHEQPKVGIPAGSSLKEGQTVKLSYFHTAIIHSDQVAACMAEEKLYDILKWELTRTRDGLRPDGYFLSHDEIRVAGWDESCQRTGKTPGGILADNVGRCAKLARQVDPGKGLLTWSDMFDPFHNAAPKGRYYLVKGEGPWSGSWKGLPSDVTVMNWHNHKQGRRESMQHFAALGNKQVLAGYYDGPVANIRDWLAEAKGIDGIIGVMYTTWRHDYSNLEAFNAEVDKAAAGR